MMTLVYNVLKTDPTRTTTIRRRFVAEMTRRFKDVDRAVWKLLVQEDALGLNPRVLVTQEAQIWRFHTDSQKLTAYHDWLQQQIDAGILNVNVQGDPWTAKYVESSYKKGLSRAYVDVNKTRTDFYEGTQSQFLQEAFHAPETLSKLALLNTRTFEELRGVTASMSQQMGRVLADGMAKGQGPATIAREMTKVVKGITKKRANVIARTEVIHAHAEGQLDAFEKLDVKELNIVAEWSTAGDDRVCERCSGYEGEMMTVDEARGLIPLHPNCRCMWKPAEKKVTESPLEYRLPEALPETPEVKALLQTEATLRKKTAELRKAYRGGDKSLRPALMKSKKELQAVRTQIDKLAGKAPPVPVPKPPVPKPPVPKPPVPKPPVPAATSGTKFATAEDYRQYLIQQVKAAKDPVLMKKIDELKNKTEDLWEKYIKFFKTDREAATKFKEAAWAVDKELKAARKAVKVSVKAQRKLLDEVNSMAGKVELITDSKTQKTYKSVVDELLSWVPKNREVTKGPRFTELLVNRSSRGRYGLLGSYNHGYNTQISMFTNSKRVFAHEFGHHLQYQLDGFMSAQTKFFKSRTVGEKVVKLFRDVTGKKDKWRTYDIYAGRIYADGRAAEVASIGIEHIWANPYRAATKDPEWFNMIISQLKGIPTKSGAKAFKVGKAAEVAKGSVGSVAKTTSKKMLATEKTLKTKLTAVRKAYRGGDRSLRPKLLKLKEELKVIQDKIDDVAGGIVPKAPKVVKPKVVKPVPKIKQFGEKLTKKEIEAVQVYTKGMSFPWNEGLMGKRRLDRGMKKGIAQLSKALNKMPNYTGEVWRGITMESSAELEKLLATMKVGKSVLFKGFTSTSAVKSTAKQYLFGKKKTILLKIQSKQGKSLEKLAWYGEGAEKEVLFNKEARFKIIRIFKERNQNIVELSEII